MILARAEIPEHIQHKILNIKPPPKNLDSGTPSMFLNNHWSTVMMARYYIPAKAFKAHIEHSVDVGCGQGWGTWIISITTGKPVVGFDRNRFAIDYANTNFPGLSYQRRTLENIPYNAFDTIFMMDVIEHLTYEEGAQFARTVRNTHSVRNIFMSSTFPDRPRPVPKEQQPAHKHFFTKSEIEKLFHPFMWNFSDDSILATGTRQLP